MKNMTLILFCFLTLGLFAQNQENSLESKETAFDARLTRHYSVEELIDLQNNHSEKYNQIEYYYLHSYKIERISCDECGNLPFTHFDIAHFEKLRKKNEPYIREYTKYGYKVTIYPLSELTSLTPLQEFLLNH